MQSSPTSVSTVRQTCRRLQNSERWAEDGIVKAEATRADIRSGGRAIAGCGTFAGLENTLCNSVLTSACWICTWWSPNLTWWCVKYPESSWSGSCPKRVGVLLKEIPTSLTSCHVFVKYEWTEFPLILISEAKKQTLLNVLEGEGSSFQDSWEKWRIMCSYWMLFFLSCIIAFCSILNSR